MNLISVVIPLYNEEGNVAELIGRLTTIMERVASARGDAYEIVAVNDGSSDGTLAALRALRPTHPRLGIVDLSRNFGHQIAATAGLDAARGDAVVLMDGDLQDPPELVERFLEKWREGYDVVYATRKARRGESIFKRWTARAFYRTIRSLTNVSIPVDTGDFRLMSRRVVDGLARTREKHRFLRGLVSWIGYRQIGIEYERDARFTGETKYPFSKMLRFAIDGITSFSEIPLRFATYLGFTVSVFAFVYIVVVLVNKALGANEPGYTSIMVALLFLGGVILISLGIIGEYLGRIYDQVKERPLYLLSSIERDAVPLASAVHASDSPGESRRRGRVDLAVNQRSRRRALARPRERSRDGRGLRTRPAVHARERLARPYEAPGPRGEHDARAAARAFDEVARAFAQRHGIERRHVTVALGVHGRARTQRRERVQRPGKRTLSGEHRGEGARRPVRSLALPRAPLAARLRIRPRAKSAVARASHTAASRGSRRPFKKSRASIASRPVPIAGPRGSSMSVTSARERRPKVSVKRTSVRARARPSSTVATKAAAPHLHVVDDGPRAARDLLRDDRGRDEALGGHGRGQIA